VVKVKYKYEAHWFPPRSGGGGRNLTNTTNQSHVGQIRIPSTATEDLNPYAERGRKKDSDATADQDAKEKEEQTLSTRESTKRELRRKESLPA